MIRIETTTRSDDVAMALAAIDDFCIIQVTENGFLIFNESYNQLTSMVVDVQEQFQWRNIRIATC